MCCLFNSAFTNEFEHSEFYLSRNYSNLFNLNTNIEFLIPKNDFVTLKIFNILGEDVAALLSGRMATG